MTARSEHEIATAIRAARLRDMRMDVEGVSEGIEIAATYLDALAAEYARQMREAQLKSTEWRYARDIVALYEDAAAHVRSIKP